MPLNGFVKNSDLENYLKNKKVIIVGPSPHISCKKLGNVIDQYDVICRLNEIFPVGLEQDYGSRTDIAFLNCYRAGINTQRYKMKESEKIAKKMSFIICPIIKSAPEISLGQALDGNGGDMSYNVSLVNIYNIPYVLIGLENFKKVYYAFNGNPNIGSTAILMLLQYPIKELAITGISFYQQGDINSPETHAEGYSRYYHENYPPPPEFINEVDSIVNPYKSHPIELQVKYFKEFILTEYSNVVKIDSYLNTVLKLNYHNVF